MVARRLQDQRIENESWSFAMRSQHQAARRARERARQELQAMPISDDENLLKLQEQAEEYFNEAKRRVPSEPGGLVTTLVDAVARDYFQYTIRKQQRRAR
jgi:hemerythrin-like domain-containing protein